LTAPSSSAEPAEGPFAVAGIRNFGWVEPGILARGEQPALLEETFFQLHELGIRTVVSLRPDREPPPRQGRRVWTEYRVEEEQHLVERAGLHFGHAPMEDFSAPAPEDVAAALSVVDAAVAEAPPVYVHCRAGAGRAALVTGAWIVSRGRSGDRAAALYQRFMKYVFVAFPTDEWPANLQRVGQPHLWWALREVVDALGSPVTYQPEYLLPPQRPPGAEGWEQGYREVLRPWTNKRPAAPLR
jgi:protein tyrosine phosphatase (PTP) superfamily phosphohydrolase (DUF442 family)